MKYSLILLAIILLSTVLHAQKAGRTLFTLDGSTVYLSAYSDYSELDKRGIESVERGEHELAASLFKLASELNPSCYVCRYNHARTLMKLKRFGAAVPLLEQVLRQHPGFAVTHASIGDAYSLMEEDKTSLIHYGKALELDPEDAVTLNNRANSLERLGRYREALLDLEKAIAIRPKLFEAHCSRGVVLFKLGKRADALESLRAAERINAADAPTLNNLGVVPDSIGKTEGAIAYYRRSAAADPDFAPALFNLGLVHVEQGKRNEAARTLKALEPLDADLGAELRKQLWSKWVLQADVVLPEQ